MVAAPSVDVEVSGSTALGHLGADEGAVLGSREYYPSSPKGNAVWFDWHLVAHGAVGFGTLIARLCKFQKELRLTRPDRAVLRLAIERRPRPAGHV